MVGADCGRLVMWSVVGVLHFYWYVVGGRCLNQYMVSGQWFCTTPTVGHFVVFIGI